MTSQLTAAATAAATCIGTTALGFLAQTAVPISHDSPVTMGLAIGAVTGVAYIAWMARGTRDDIRSLKAGFNNLPCVKDGRCPPTPIPSEDVNP